MSIEIFHSYKNGNWYFRLKSRNGRTIAQSEGYKSKQGMMKTIKRYWGKSLVEEITSPSL